PARPQTHQDRVGRRIHPGGGRAADMSMRRFLARSLAGQMALLIGGALHIAQICNFGLLLNERQRLSLARNEGPGLSRFVNTAADYAQADGGKSRWCSGTPPVAALATPSIPARPLRQMPNDAPRPRSACGANSP